MRTQADPYGANPLVEDLRLNNAAVYDIASTEMPPPTLFATGDLPLFTASGIDPQHLARLPFTMRHAAAAEASPSVVLGIIEQYAGDPMYTLEHVGLDDYRTRVHRWAAGRDVPAPVMSTQEQDAVLEELFGDNL